MINNRKELKNIRKNIGYNIYKARRRKGFTLKKLSKISNIDFLLLDQFELGKNEVNLNILMRIANSLDVSMQDFFST